METPTTHGMASNPLRGYPTSGGPGRFGTKPRRRPGTRTTGCTPRAVFRQTVSSERLGRVRSLGHPLFGDRSEADGPKGRSFVGTISLPRGAMATAAKLKVPIPRGIPMMIRQRRAPASRCARAIHNPTSWNQMMFAESDAAPAVGRHTTQSGRMATRQGPRGEERRCETAE